METLNIRGMIRSRNLSRSIHEIGWGKLIEMIRTKQNGTDMNSYKSIDGSLPVKDAMFVVK